jgi:phosphatidate cytidylyltransferase
MHLKRWITGVVAVPILVYLIGFGPKWIFYSLLLLVSLLAVLEFYRMSGIGLLTAKTIIVYLLSLALFIGGYTGQVLLEPVFVVLCVLAPLGSTLFSNPLPSREAVREAGIIAMGPIYCALPLVMLMHIHRYHGGAWIFFLLTVIFATDTGAFYCGKYFGRRKLYPSVSPGKTWEGAAGGLLMSLIGAGWFLHLVPLHALGGRILTLVVVLSVAGQIGDLAESMLKRAHGVKDSGWILPGHGGLLDRIDGLLFAVPILYLYLYLSHVVAR